MTVNGRKKWLPHQIRYVQQSRAEGHTVLQIAKDTGRSEDAIRHLLFRLLNPERHQQRRERESNRRFRPQPSRAVTVENLEQVKQAHEKRDERFRAAMEAAGFKEKPPAAPSATDFRPVTFHREPQTGIGQWD